MSALESFAQRTAALLIVDVQEGAVARGPFEVRRVLDNISRLLTACRASGVHVVYVQHDGRAGESEEPHTPGWEIHAGIRPFDDEPVVRKRFNSAFRETQLHAHLKSRGIDTLIITGIQTEYCVDTTIRVAFELGYAILLPELTNTTFDNGEVSARDIYELFNRRIFDGRFGSVISLDEALAAVQGVPR